MDYAGIETLGTMEPDNLIAGPAERVMGIASIAPGQTLKRGTVLGKVVSSAQCVPVDKSKSDGSQTVYAVLADDITTDADAGSAEVYLSGEFNISSLVFGGESTAPDHEAEARDLGIYFRKTVGA